MKAKTSKERLSEAIAQETQKFESCYRWLEDSMSVAFFEELTHEHIMLITHALMDFPLQDYFSTINLKNGALVLCLNTPDADIRVLKNFSLHGINHYRAFESNCPPPYDRASVNLRVVFLAFTEAEATSEALSTEKALDTILDKVMLQHPSMTKEECDQLIKKVDPSFLTPLTQEQQGTAVELLLRATSTDHCQYEVKYFENWNKQETPSENVSMQIVLAWRNTPKYHFLYRLAKAVHHHGLVMRKVNATYVDPYTNNSILIMFIGLHGSNGQAAWEVAKTEDLLRELVTLKYFESFDTINRKLVTPNHISRLMGNFLRSASNFIHQALVNIDPNIYTLEHITEDLCRHPELTVQLCEAFRYKFDTDVHNLEKYHDIHSKLIEEIQSLDTGHEENDKRRRNVLMQGVNFVEHILKTNIFRYNYTAVSFRLDPNYLNHIPFNRSTKYPDLPYGIFFVKGLDFFGFHIRFGDLARGGVRTVFPEQVEHMLSESNNVFNECYNLAYTQHKKNKDIPEAGAKGVIFIGTYDRLEAEAEILRTELTSANMSPDAIKTKIGNFKKEQKRECLHLAQRSYVESLITLVNCHEDGSLKAKHLVDYWKRPEYLYLGPDENLHNDMIQWIADYSKNAGYKPGTSFITSKPKAGMNHKIYGVTSLGVNVYMEEVLKFLGIDPSKERFTVKMSGGPDGDVAGNQILNLRKYYPKTAKLVALTDVSGTIYDPKGLDLDALANLFQEGQSIRFYPADLLHEGGFLVDRFATQSPSALITQTLCWKKRDNQVFKDWISGSEMNHLFRHNVHSTYADVFIPAGGRPRSLNEENWTDFLNSDGEPTSRAIVEGANLYLTPTARRRLEEKGVLIIRDSSANKAGVICSSFEVLIGLAIEEEEFMKIRDDIVPEILERLKECAYSEARLLLKTHKEKGMFLTDISEAISEKINYYTYQLLDHLDHHPIALNPSDPLTTCYLNYCLPMLRERYQEQILTKIPQHHIMSVISSQIGAQIVYSRGISWSPSIVDILPTVWSLNSK